MLRITQRWVLLITSKATSRRRNRKNTMSKKLWTGKTARQELIGAVTLKSAVSGWSVAEALEYAFDGLESARSGSITSETWKYWSNLSEVGQSRLFATMKSLVIKADRRGGFNFKR